MARYIVNCRFIAHCMTRYVSTVGLSHIVWHGMSRTNNLGCFDLGSHEFLTSEERLVHGEDLQKVRIYVHSLHLRFYSRCLDKLATSMSASTADVWIN